MPHMGSYGGKKPTASQRKVAAAFHEVMHDEPSTVSRANVSPARKQKMRVAIALNKAREAGARIPMPPKRAMGQAKRMMRDNATKGSPPMEMPEFRAGYRKMGSACEGMMGMMMPAEKSRR